MQLNKKGFTIIEIIIALTVMFLGVVSVFALYPVTYRMVEISKVTTLMTLVGQSKLDEVAAMNFDDITPGTYDNIDLTHLIDDPDVLQRFEETDMIVEAASGHNGGSATNPLSASNRPILLRVFIDVQYQLNSGKFKSELFETYVANPRY